MNPANGRDFINRHGHSVLRVQRWSGLGGRRLQRPVPRGSHLRQWHGDNPFHPIIECHEVRRRVFLIRPGSATHRAPSLFPLTRMQRGQATRPRSFASCLPLLDDLGTYHALRPCSHPDPLERSTDPVAATFCLPSNCFRVVCCPSTRKELSDDHVLSGFQKTEERSDGPEADLR